MGSKILTSEKKRLIYLSEIIVGQIERNVIQNLLFSWAEYIRDIGKSKKSF